MPDHAVEPQPLVSIQDANTTDALIGHLIWGRLAYRDYVLTAGPPDWLADEVSPEVLLSTVGLSQPPLVERIKIAKVEILGIQNRPDLQFTGLQLVRSSNFQELDPPLETIFQQPLSNEEQVRGVTELVAGPPEGISLEDAQNLLESVTHYENQFRHPSIEDKCIGEAWISPTPPMSIFCILLGFKKCR